MSQHLSVYPFIHFALYSLIPWSRYAKHCVQCLALEIIVIVGQKRYGLSFHGARYSTR